MANTPAFAVRLPADLRAAVERIAKREGISASDVVRRALREYVEEEA